MKPKPSETAVKTVLAVGSAASLAITVSRWLSSASPEAMALYQMYGMTGLYVIIFFLLVFLLESELNKH